MRIHMLRSSEKKKIIEKLKDQFGIENLSYLLIESGKEKTRGFSGHMNREEILQLNEIINIELIGLYLLKEENNELRLSFDASQILKDQINKKIVNINEEQFNLWIRGNDLDISAPKGSIVIKYLSDFVGCGKSNGQKIFNYVPKDRRLRK